MLDPYHKWLAIPPGRRPPTHYELLGVSPDETDPEVIAEAALRQTSHVRTYQAGPHSERCVALLNEIAEARATLLDLARRKAYDATLAPPPPVEPVRAEPVRPGPPQPGEEFWEELAPEEPPGGRPSGTSPGAIVWLLLYVLLLVFAGALAFWLASLKSAPADTPPRTPRGQAGSGSERAMADAGRALLSAPGGRGPVSFRGPCRRSSGRGR